MDPDKLVSANDCTRLKVKSSVKKASVAEDDSSENSDVELTVLKEKPGQQMAAKLAYAAQKAAQGNVI